MTRRLSDQKLRDLLYMMARGKCEACGGPLQEGWHADHYIPYSVVPETNFFNMRALCPDCNLKKGARMELSEKVKRAHQLCDQIEHFGSALRRHQADTVCMTRGIATGMGGGKWPYMTQPGYMVQEIVPGGGKSYNAVMASSVLVGSGLFDVAFWISPRLTLMQQAKDDFASTGLARRLFQKDIAIFNPAGLIPQEVPETNRAERLLDRSVKVWVLPYQRLASVSNIIEHMVNDRNVLFIFDEFQLLRDYSKDDNSEVPDGWFSYLGSMTTACQRKTGLGGIILSGGLYRNDGHRLPLIQYRQGDVDRGEDPKKAYPLSDISYTLSEAQADRCIIRIDFDFYDGEVEFCANGGASEFESLIWMDDENYDAKLRLFLDTPEVWKTIINDMLESLDAYNPSSHGYRARYMVTSKSIEDAEMHADYLRSVKFREPLLIHSKLTEAEKKKLDEFRRGHGPWDGLVSVAMGYIGLSIPDLSHLAYLSHYRSSAWINQAFHRVTRTDNHARAPRYEDQLARIFLPNDPNMRAVAEEIMQNQNPGVLAFPRPKPPGTPPGGGLHEPKDFEPVGASIEGRQFRGCSEHGFIDNAVRAIPALNSLPRKVVEEFKAFSDRYGGRG